jgi:DNA modification methylase
MQSQLGRLDHLTFKGNLRHTRYGWLRLTPAYSVHLVSQLLDDHWHRGKTVLDPFCGTGTTALLCAERGIRCDTTDINPFLLWLCTVKTRSYSAREVEELRRRARRIERAIEKGNQEPPWTPPLHQIEKWWSARVLAALGRAIALIHRVEDECGVAIADLLKIAFCRTLIAHANVSFGHQSMSFKKQVKGVFSVASVRSEQERVAETFGRAVADVAAAAAVPLVGNARAIYCDARDLRQKLRHDRYGCVITSPPYPNRMSYIRELRPYMYWLGYLSDGRQAGELDWQAIGGTWGSATSNVAKWTAPRPLVIPYRGFDAIVEAVAQRSQVLARYVAKYFHDMTRHCRSLFAVVKAGGTIHYIVGNSKFYDVMLPVERIFAAVFEAVGFSDVRVDTIRKRTSKKELYEFVVSARKR